MPRGYQLDASATVAAGTLLDEGHSIRATVAKLHAAGHQIGQTSVWRIARARGYAKPDVGELVDGEAMLRRARKCPAGHLTWIDPCRMCAAEAEVSRELEARRRQIETGYR